MENKTKTYTINFTKEVSGYFEIEATDKADALKKFYEGDFINEVDNKSNYVYDEDDDGEVLIYEDE